jgi:transcriptional regulator with XRE-family HTH domain
MEKEIKTNSRKASATKISVLEQVCLDTALYLDKFANKNLGIKTLARKTSLSERTIQRILSQKNNPTFQTLYSLYMEFLDAPSEVYVYENCPQVIKNELEGKNPNQLREKKSIDCNFFALIKKHPLMAEIYIMAALAPIDKNSISFRYGQYGVELLEEMSKLGIIDEVSKSIFILSSSAPEMTSQIVKHFGLHFVERFSKPENTNLKGENMMSFYCEKLNEEGLNQWLKIDREAFYKKVEISKNNIYKGHIDVFSFNAIDTMTMEKNNV